MWIWQLIIRRAKKVTIPLTDKNCTPLLINCCAKEEIFSRLKIAGTTCPQLMIRDERV